MTLDAAFLSATAHGEPTLAHGYALTAHVAQGSTVDRAYVLADDGLSREWAYTALSRGRQHNALYIGGGHAIAREEIAPRGPAERSPRERLIAALQSSEASVLAIDSGSRRAERTARELERWTASAAPRGLTRTDLMTAKEVAELLEVPVSTVRQWGRNGTLPRVKLGRHIRFLRAQIEATILSAAQLSRGGV